MGGRGSSSKRVPYSKPRLMEAPAEEEEREERTAPDDDLEALEKASYHYFYDKMEDGWNYEGDGHHQVDWFGKNSNVDEILDSVDSETKSAMSSWTSGHFMGGQQYDGWDKMSRSDKEKTQRYDDMLDKSVMYKGVTVVRRATSELLLGKGAGRPTLEQLQAMEGQTVVSKGNMSTGAAKQGLTISSTGVHKPCEYRIHIPAGSKGAGMWIGDKRVNPGWQAKQREFMTNRDIMLKVGKTTYDKARNVFVTDVYYTGRLDHDYGKSGRVK